MPAELTITVTRFVENRSNTPSARPDQNCDIEPELQMNGSAIGEWRLDPEGQVFLCPPPDVGTIAVRRKAGSTEPVALTFRIASRDGVPALRPTRIAFEQLNYRKEPKRPKEDPDGSRNFTDQAVTPEGLTIKNRWLHHGRSKNRLEHHAPQWKFWIRVTTADGRVGWIDPTIENSEDMSA